MIIKRNNKSKGFTLVESLAALTVISGLSYVGIDYTIAALDKAKYDEHAVLPIQLLKAVDRRVEIDGYKFSLWNGLPTTNNTEEILEFSKRAFISKDNAQCGLSDGWVPQLSTSSKEAIIPCDFDKNKYDIYDYQMSMSSNINGYLLSQDIIMRIKPAFDLKEKGLFLKHKNLVSKIKATQPDLESGIFSVSFINFLNQNDKVNNEQCMLLGNNCAIKVSWKSEGFNESLRLDGTNTLIDSHISFADGYYSDKRKCLIWEYDDVGNYTLNTTKPFNCGIGIYNKTMNPIVATVDAAVEDLSSFEPIILKQNCNTYARDGSGYLVANGVTECGLYTGKNGTQNVIQIVENLQVDSGNSSLNDTMIVDNLISDIVNTDSLNVINNLIVEGASNLTTLSVKNGASTILNQAVTMKILENMTKTQVVGNLNVINNTDASTSINDGLDITGALNLNNTGQNTISDSLSVSNLVNVGSLKLTSNISNGSFCLFSEEGDVAFDGKNILVCKKSVVGVSYRWSSNRDGEILAFNGACPSGWTSFDDASGKTLVGNGKIFDPISGILEYQTGQISAGAEGQAFVKLNINEIPAHQHGYDDVYYSEKFGPLGAGSEIGAGSTDYDNNFYMNEKTTAVAGSDQAHENRMPYISLKYCMYMEGNKMAETFADPTASNSWFPYSSHIGNWINYGTPSACTGDIYNDSRPSGGTETWSRTCNVNQERFTSEREINYITGVIRNTGIITREVKVVSYPEVWYRATPTYGLFYNISAPYDCGRTPVSVVDRGTYYDVTLSCKIDKRQTVQERLMRNDGLGLYTYRNFGLPTTRDQTFVENVVFPENKTSVTLSCGAWTTSASENAKPWSPDTSAYDTGVAFTQTRIIQQTRNCVSSVTIGGVLYSVDTNIQYQNLNQSRPAVGTNIPAVVTPPVVTPPVGSCTVRHPIGWGERYRGVYTHCAEYFRSATDTSPIEEDVMLNGYSRRYPSRYGGTGEIRVACVNGAFTVVSESCRPGSISIE